MAVGTGNISLQDVIDEFESIEGPGFLSSDSLFQAFNNSNSDGFDGAHAVSGSDRLSEFRGYDHDAAATTYSIGLSGIPASSTSSRRPATGETFTITFNVSPDPNTVSGSCSFVAFGDGTSWASFPNGGNTGVSDGDTFQATIAANAIDGPPRAIKIRISSGSTGVTNSPRDYEYYQAAGRDYDSNSP